MQSMRDGGPSTRSGNPLAQLAARQRELESELVAARKATSHARAKAGNKQWHIKPPHIHEDEGWYTTYLDVMTLLLVLLVVMLSFAGKGALEGFRQATGGSTIPGLRASATPSLEGVPQIDLGPLRAGIGLLPANNGLLPEIGLHHNREPGAYVPLPGTDIAPMSEQPLPPPAPPQSVMPTGAPPETLAGVAVAPTADPREANATPPPLDPARVGPAPVDPHVIATAPIEPVADAPIRPNPAPAVPAPPSPARASSKQDMLAGLPVGELGDDIDVIVNERSVSFRINSEILFGSGEADLSVPGLAVLKRLIPVFNSVDHKLTVEGHTDSVPMLRNRRYPSNWELSGARAGSVVRYLEANGVASTRLRAVGNADTRPLSDNTTPEGRASNRRVELIMERKEE